MNPEESSQLYQHFDRHKIAVMRVLLIFTVIGGVVFFSINFPLGFHALASVELLAAIISLLLWFYLKKDISMRLFRRIAFCYVFMLCCIMLFAFAPMHTSITVFNFALLIPLLTHLLLGSRTGMIITAVFLCLALLLFVYKNHDLAIITNPSDIANIVTVTLLIWGLAYSYERANETAKEKLIYLAGHDFLTGLYNRVLLNDIFQHKLKHSISNDQPLSLILADLDHFKQINDEYGHKAGDYFIIKFAEILRQYSGTNGRCFRIGGEEFCVLLSSTSLAQSVKVAEKIRRATEQIVLESTHHKTPVTVSLGVVSCQGVSCQLSKLLKSADQNLYRAKQQGRNKVVA